jgi:hypothetical protein
VHRRDRTYNAFGVVATPSTAVINTEGKIVHEAASYLRSTGEDIRESVEILLGVRAAPKADAVAAKPAYKPDSKALRHFSFGRTMLQRGNKDKAMGQLEEAPRPTPFRPRVFWPAAAAKKDRRACSGGGEFSPRRRRPGDVCATGGEARSSRARREAPRRSRRPSPRPDPHAGGVNPRSCSRSRASADAEARSRRARAQPLTPAYFRRAGSEAGASRGPETCAPEILMNLLDRG